MALLSHSYRSARRSGQRRRFWREPPTLGLPQPSLWNLRSFIPMATRNIGRVFETMRAAVRQSKWMTPARGVTLSVACVALLGCTSLSGDDPCGPRPPIVAEITPAPWDPYNQWRRLVRSADQYNDGVRAGDDADLRGPAWNVCRSALGLKPYTREVDPEIRPRFAAALNTVIAQSRTEARDKITWLASPGTSRPLQKAIVELSAAIPRFWLESAASLRGRGQPGSPLFTHK